VYDHKRPRPSGVIRSSGRNPNVAAFQGFHSDIASTKA
jgi:hypothetical protein